MLSRQCSRFSDLYAAKRSLLRSRYPPAKRRSEAETPTLREMLMFLMFISSRFVAGPPSSGPRLLGRRGGRLGDHSRAGYFRWGRYPLGGDFPYARNRSSLVAIVGFFLSDPSLTAREHSFYTRDVSGFLSRKAAGECPRQSSTSIEKVFFSEMLENSMTS